MKSDLIIIGGSAAGASAVVYASRRGLKPLVIAKDLGGEVATSGDIENWLGITHTDGFTLSSQFRAHLESYKPEVLEGYLVTKLEKRGEGDFVVTLDDGSTREGRAVIIASGIHPKELGVPGEKDYRLKGISYCTVCDGPLFTGKKCVTIGGGNSALESALMLADLCSEVTVINKNAQFKGEQILIDNLKAKKNVTVISEAMTTDFFGDPPPAGFAKGLHYTDASGSHELTFDGSFVHIGNVPNSQFTPPDIKKDQFGAIMVDASGATSVPGIFAAGDVTDTPHKQIIIAAGMGATAALSAVQYMNRIQT